MESRPLILAIALVLMVGACEGHPQFNQDSHLQKRSLCNTFGGCGFKRSLPSGPNGPFESYQDEYDADTSLLTNGLLAQILEDVAEQIKDQRYPVSGARGRARLPNSFPAHPAKAQLGSLQQIVSGEELDELPN